MDEHVVRGLPQYTSYRLTVVDRSVVEDLFEGYQYISGFETSVKGVAHFHIILYGYPDDRLEKRWARLKCPNKTDKWKRRDYKEDFLKGISYTVKGGDVQVVGAEMEYWVTKAPKWEFRVSVRDGEDNVQKRWLLTERNVIPIMRKYVEDNDQLAGKGFEHVLEWVLSNTKWRAGGDLRRGIDKIFKIEFEQAREDASREIVFLMMERGARRYV